MTTHEDDVTLLTAATSEILERSDSQQQPTIAVFPDTEAGRRFVTEIERLAAQRQRPKPSVSPSVPATSRRNRRRSRQCRGPRARNYVRAVVRAANGAAADSGALTVLADAKHTGALAASQWQQEQRR
jgi:hypothetical protein